MKDRDEKYMEAVERNLSLHERILKNSPQVKQKYKGMKLAEACHGIGIRSTDSHYDDRVSKLIK